MKLNEEDKEDMREFGLLLLKMNIVAFNVLAIIVTIVELSKLI